MIRPLRDSVHTRVRFARLRRPMRFPVPPRHLRSRIHRRARVLAVSVAVLLSPRIGAADADGPPAVSVAQVEDEAAGAEGPAPGEAPQTPEKAAEVPAEATQAAPGIEVIRVRGKGAAAIEAAVPSSLTVFDASTLEALGAEDISDLSRVTPNVNIVQPGSTQATFFVRGIGLSDFSANAAGAVTIFQDDVAIDAPAIQTGQLFDVRNVEIMRGPQGTGPYRNASGGSIRVESALPSGNYGSQLRSSIGRYEADGGKGAHHSLIQDYEGYLEAPIAADFLSSRSAFRLRNSDPYQTNGCGDAPPFEARTPRLRASITRDSL